eukprot:COSAG01_NODE_38823_length_484_cov_9.628571_1_plen_54_part_10
MGGAASPLVLVMAPTRELAVQIAGECEKFTGSLRSLCVYGGVPLVSAQAEPWAT